MRETDSPVEIQEADAASYRELIAWCLHCDPAFQPTGPDDWCNCQCHDTELADAK